MWSFDWSLTRVQRESWKQANINNSLALFEVRERIKENSYLTTVLKQGDGEGRGCWDWTKNDNRLQNNKSAKMRKLLKGKQKQ